MSKPKPKIKPLEWEKSSTNSWEAKTEFGFYTIIYTINKKFFLKYLRGGGRPFTSLQLAQNEAQKDWFTKIKSCLI
jgi:hypothetical protein